MKNKLLGTAAIFLALGVSNTAFAGECEKAKPGGVEPVLKMSGSATGTYHAFRNGQVARGEKGFGTLFAIEDTNLNFQAKGRMDSGWTDRTFYDWFISLTGDTNEKQTVDENRISLKGRWGTAMFGNTNGVENFMSRGAFGVVGATGGFDGNFKTTTSKPTGLLLSTDMVGASKKATKFTYVTPRFYGFQGGISYTPNSEHKGGGSTSGAPHNKTSNSSPQEAFDLHNMAFGLNYINKFANGFSTELSATAVVGKTRPARGKGVDNSNLFNAETTVARHNTKSYALGAVASYQCFDFGVEWINNGKSRQIKNAPAALAQAARAPGAPDPGEVDKRFNGPIGQFNAGKVFSVAGAYSFGLNKVSYGYSTSKRKFNGQNTTGKVHSLAFDRSIAPGFSVFAEGVAFALKSKSSSVAYQNALKVNYDGPADGAPSTGLVGNNGRTLLIGATTKF